jgi:hypothetical protein
VNLRERRLNPGRQPCLAGNGLRGLEAARQMTGVQHADPLRRKIGSNLLGLLKAQWA